MNERIPKLPDAELDVMMTLWEAETPLTSSQVMEALRDRKTWGLTTVLNFLTRLTERGFLAVEKRGRVNLYTVLIPKEAYLQEASAGFLEKLHGNSVRHLVASLYDSAAINDHDLAELRKFIDEKEKEKGDIPRWLL